jgi:hypothetical protein
MIFLRKVSKQLGKELKQPKGGVQARSISESINAAKEFLSKLWDRIKLCGQAQAALDAADADLQNPNLSESKKQEIKDLANEVWANMVKVGCPT